MIIQKLEPSKHKQGRWLVWFEDGSLVRVGEGEVVSLGLYAGKELTDQEGEALIVASGRAKLNERAMTLLTTRPMSRKELVDKLTTVPRRRGKPGQEEVPSPDPEILHQQREALETAAEAVAGRLTELGLLNDREYAHTVARHYAAKGYGERRLREELYRRGVPREYWEEALEANRAEESKVEQLVRQKLRGQEPTRENLKRVSDYLARRGFGWEEISAVLERYRRDCEDLL